MPLSGNGVLVRTVVRSRRRLSIGTALICLHQVCEALVPILIGVIIDRAIDPRDGWALAAWIAVLAVLFTTLTTVYRLGARQLMLAIAEEAHQLRLEVAAKVLHPRGVRTEMRTGDLLAVSTSDTDNTSYLLDYVPRIAGAIVATAVSAAALLVIDVPLGLVVLIATPLLLLALQVSTPFITRRVADQQERAGAATSTATDLVTGVRPLRGIGAEAAAARRYREVSQLSLRASLRAARTQGLYVAASTSSSALLACGIAILAGWFALTGRISIGEFITVIGLAQFLIEPAGLLAIVPSWVAEARASANRVAQVLNADHRVPDGPASLVDGPAGVEIRALRYGPLDGVDLRAEAGEFVGVVAHRSADAEALVRILAGRVGPDEYEGGVLVGGQHLAGIQLAHSRRTMLVEPHHTDLFAGTIGANITAGSGTDLPGDLLDRVLAASAADQVLTAHPDGIDHIVVERGASLSGGQRQRVALARALLAQPSILVLHDPTTAVDAVTEHAIAQAVRGLRHGPDFGGADQRGNFTTIVVTSSPAMLAATDRVVVLDGGRVVAEGSHAELGTTDDDYRSAVLR